MSQLAFSPSFAPTIAPFPIPVVTIHAQPSWEMPEEIEDKITRAEKVLTKLLEQGCPVCVSWSAGKDSSTVLNLLLVAAAKLSAEGVVLPPIVVTHADTLVESPEMTSYARGEMAQVMRFAKLHQLNVTIEVSEPLLTAQWAVRVIGGRALPTFPGTNRDCSTSFKVLPMKKLRKQVLKKLQGKGTALNEPVVLLGTRYEESSERARNMRERGESDVQVRRGIDENGKASDLFLSPIAFWSSDDVWTYLSMARGGDILTYSTFEETFRIYADSMGTSCVIVAEDMYKSLKSSKACGARTGCSVCTAVTADKSMENMLASDTRYEYMRGLNQLRNFLSNTRWDMDRRSWLGRTIKDGYVRISPDAYSPAMMEELLRYALTLDVLEEAASRKAGLRRPRFELIGIQQIFAIDAMWSLQAFHRPFHALKIYQEIKDGGQRFPVPVVQPFARPKELPARYLWVGRDWEDGDRMAYTGLRSAIHELASMDSDGCMGSKVLKDGRSVLAINTGELLSFETETAYFVLGELDELITNHHDNPQSSPTQAYFYYGSLGMMTVKSGMEGELDQILRRSNFKVRQGLDGQIDVKDLWARAVSAEQAGVVVSSNGRLKKRGAAGSLSVAHQTLLEDSNE